MRAVGYSRADPADVHAREHLAAQREVIAAEAGRRGWELIEVFEDIASGQDLSGREGLNCALAAVESRQARELLVADVARLSTSLSGLAWLAYASRRRAWTLVCIAEQAPGGDPAAGLALPVLDAVVPVLRSVTFDCRDPDTVASFWAAATGYRKEASPEPGQYAVISDLSGQGPVFWFNRVPQPKTGKNWVHVDLNVQALDDEVERLAGLGAAKAEEHASPSGKAWVVMNDPEGNEFCLVQVSRF
jgi:predicted enzyme related to lactoylglutathione lyase